MRRTVAIALVAVGTTLLVLGLGLKFWAYPRLATVPLDQKSTTVSTGENMAVLVIRAEGVRVARGVTVTSTRQVDGNARAALDKGGDDEAFWETSVESVATGIGVLSQTKEGVSFDRFTGQATNCCGDYLSTVRAVGDSFESTDAPVTHKGLFYKFPFDTQKDDYPFWDGDLKDAPNAAYAATETIEGLSTYKFVQRIPDTTLEQRDVPASLFQPGQAGNVTADLVYTNTRTLWVEPNTGVIIKGQEEVDKRLVWQGLEAEATVGTIAYSPQTVTDQASAWGDKGRALGLVGGTLPVLVAALGALMLLGGLAMVTSAARSGGGRRVLAPDDTVDLTAVEAREHGRR
jgi:hypothetical protein